MTGRREQTRPWGGMWPGEDEEVVRWINGVVSRAWPSDLDPSDIDGIVAACAELGEAEEAAEL